MDLHRYKAWILGGALALLVLLTCALVAGLAPYQERELHTFLFDERCVLAEGCQEAVIPGTASPSRHHAQEYGTWIWESPYDQSEAYFAEKLDAAAANGFTSVYLTVDDYLRIAALPEGPDKESQKRTYRESIAAIVRMAGERGIEVDLEGGARDWGKSENRWKGYALITLVGEYNRAYPDAPVRGLQYDVESYLLPEYEGDKQPVLREFLAFIDESATRMSAMNTGFSVVVPHFYDRDQAWTPAVEYEGRTAHAFSHLLTILEQKPGSTIIVMAYRDYLEGDNGTVQVSSAELREAEGTSTRVVIAQETGNVDPDFVTFFGASKAETLAAFQGVREALGGYTSFGGIAVHYLDPFLELY